VTAAVYRAAYVTDAATRADPVRERALLALGRTDPLLADRAGEVRRLDSRYAVHPRLMLAHVVFGGVFLAFAPFQFWARLRNRHRRLHRWSGRPLLVVLMLSTVPALYFGLRVPFGSGGEALVIGVVAVLLLIAGGQAFVAIRRGQVARHREWMLRVFALALGIATVRLVLMPLDLALTTLAVRPATVFVVSLWLGWGVTVAIAELWIIRTRTVMPRLGTEPATGG
jgi:uncharacterized membrane protein